MFLPQLFRQASLFRAITGALLLLLGAASARAEDVLLTLPFENVSGRAEYNWVGESFVVLYGDLLETKQLKVLDPDERNLVYERLGLRASDILTRAAVIRVAENAQANLALIGTYDIGGDRENASIAITARLIEVSSGRLVGNKVFTRSGSLNELLAMQGELAWNVLNERNRASTVSKDDMISMAKAIPPRAYESLVKGVQTQDAKVREMLLRRALQEAETAGQQHYAQAFYELGLHFYKQGNFVDATEQLRQLTNADPRYLESQFFLGMAAYRLGNALEAATAFDHLVEPLPLPEIFNNAGAMWVAKGEAARGLALLRRAVAQSPNDSTYRFNYGYALWKAQNFAEAAQHLKVAADQGPRDGEAWFLYAKSLESAGSPEATKVDDQAKRIFTNYARWAVAPDKIPSLFRIKSEFNRAQFFRYQRVHDKATKQIASAPAVAPAPLPPASQPVSNVPVSNVPVSNAVTAAPAQPGNANLAASAPASGNLERARQLVEARNDNEALQELQKILFGEATNSEAHYLRGVVLQRRNELEGAVSAFQSAVYWNPRHINGHLALSRLFLNRNDRALALTHARQALQIDPQNREAISLKQQLETGR